MCLYHIDWHPASIRQVARHVEGPRQRPWRRPRPEPSSPTKRRTSGVVVASSTTSMSTWCSSPSIGAACSTRKCSTGANKSWRRYARTSTRPLPSSTEPKTMSTYSCSTPPKVAGLSHLVNSLKGDSSRRLRQDFVGRINRAGMRGRFWSPSHFAGSCGGAPLHIVKDYIADQKRPD
jgi:hypothetical protein